MKLVIRPFAVFLPFAMVASAASAQDWEFSAAIYGWGPDTSVTLDTPVGTATGELSFSEAWEALDLAFMGTVSAQRGKLSLILDTIFLDMSDSRATPGVLGFSSANITSKVNVTNAYALWEVMSSGTGRLDVGGGARFYSTDSTVSFAGGPGPLSFDVSDDWIDPVVAVRYRADFGQDWYGTLFADVGGFGNGSEFTWQGLATVGYRFTDSFSVEGGYRILQSDRIESNGSIDIELSGLIVGARWQF